MRKTALLLAVIFAAAAPTIASAKHVKHHVRHHVLAARAAAPAEQDPNGAIWRALGDLGASLGKQWPSSGAKGSAE
jgi:hypothetical protein